MCFLFLLVGSASAGAADAQFLRIWPQWRDTESFQRIGEFFGGEEDNGSQIVLRTDPKDRDGYYFLVRVKHANSLGEAKFALHIIRPDAPDARVFTFPITGAPRSGETVFQLGLTGADWPGGKNTHPVAWKLELLGADNRVLVAEKSFLWEQPSQ